MAWSWVRVATGTSPRMQDCLDGDPSSASVEKCIREIVASHDGEVAEVRFEPNGRWARVLFSWNEPQRRLAILRDLEAEEVQELLSGDEMDRLRG